MSLLYGNISPKGHPLFWNGQKYYYNAGVNASSLNTSKLNDFSDFLMNNQIMTATPECSSLQMTRANNLFDGDTVLVTVTSPLHVSNCTTFSNAFRNCAALENVRFSGTLKTDVDLHYSPMLTIESVLSICYSMGYVSRQLRLSSSISSYANEYVKVNATGDGLVLTSASDPECLGTLAQYATGKGWSMVFV